MVVATGCATSASTPEYGVGDEVQRHSPSRDLTFKHRLYYLPAEMQEEMDVFHAIADPNRRKLLDLVATRERSVQDLAEHFDMTVQGVSQHLQLLAAAGLVSRRRVGRFRYYQARPRPLRRVHSWVSRYERFWTRRLDRLGEYLNGKKDGS